MPAILKLDDKLTPRLKALKPELKRGITLAIARVLNAMVRYAKKLFKPGNYQRIGPRGGLKPVPPPSPDVIYRRWGTYQRAIAFDMIGEMSGMSYVRSMSSGRGDPATYGPALASRWGLPRNPLGATWELKTKKQARVELQKAVRAALDNKGIALTGTGGPSGVVNYSQSSLGVPDFGMYGGMEGF